MVFTGVEESSGEACLCEPLESREGEPSLPNAV